MDARLDTKTKNSLRKPFVKSHWIKDPEIFYSDLSTEYFHVEILATTY